MSENIPYIIAENGYYYVAYKEKVKVPEIVVSSKGVANGLSEEYNDGWDFGPDSYSPTSTSAIPYTQSTGFGEALQYAINNPTMYNSDVGGYWIPEVRFTGGYYTISQPIVLNVPYRIMNLTLKGVDSMSPYIGCAFNTTSSDEYPYAVNINSSDLSNIVNINIQWENMQPYVPSGYSPYGLLNLDFSSVNTNTNVFIGYNLNISNPGFAHALNLLGFQQIYMYNLENYGSNNYLNSGKIVLFGGINDGGGTYVSGSSIYDYNYGSTPNGDITFYGQWGGASPNIGEYNADQTFTIGTLFYGYGSGLGSFNHSLFIQPSSGTITINNLIVRNIVADGLSGNTSFMGSQGASTVINNYDIRGVYSTNSYVWVLPTENTTDGTTAGTVNIRMVNSSPTYKKAFIIFDGYENDTTTNQSIDFPIAFSTVAGITGNTTGLTVSATTSGITITAPDATTTYSGIVIVEGY